MPILELFDPGPTQDDGPVAIENVARLETTLIIAVHGLYESCVQTWTDLQTNVLWLRDLYPQGSIKSRILLYDYDVTALTSPEGRSTERVLACAEALVAELCAQRSNPHVQRRPIIFVCHGFGGLVVKQALAFSQTRQAQRIEHQRSIYLSTYAILFMGTPHKGMKKDPRLFSHYGSSDKMHILNQSLVEGSEIIRDIEHSFADLIDLFCIYNFWEEVQTQFSDSCSYIVDEESAAPAWNDVEKCGLRATHSGMAKYGHAEDYGYQLISEALKRYSSDAPDHIRVRWQNSARSSGGHKARSSSASPQLSLIDVPTNDTFATDLNKWFLVERKPTTFFTGREGHARNVKSKFSEAQRQVGRKSHAMFVVYGLGGSGKTQFCLKYAHDNRSRYWGVFWIDASTPENAEASYANIDQQVRNGSYHSKGASYSAAMHWLLQSKKPWLIVLDNADDPDMDMSRFVPAGSHGHILVTTRNPNAIEHATVGHVKFQGMDPEEAISLLLKTATSIDQAESPNLRSRSFAERIASELGYLALPLAQAGATIRRKIYSLERYLYHYPGHRKAMMSYPRARSIDEANIITTWEIPFQRIVRRASPEHMDAVDLLHVFAFMHFESIPEEVFHRAWTEIEETQGDSSKLPSFFRTIRREDFQGRLRSAIQVLANYSLLDHDPSSHVFMLHPVIHSWARERLNDQDQSKWSECAMSILGLSVSRKLEASGRKFRQVLVPHMNSCLAIFRVRRPHLLDSLELIANLEKFAWVYAENGEWVTARDLQLKIVEYRKKHQGRSHYTTVRARRHLGSIYWNLFDFRPLIALQLWNLFVLWLIRPSIGCWFISVPWLPNYTLYCLALDDLAQSLWLIGRRERSRKVGERAVTGLMKHLGPEDPQTLNAMFNLARTYLHLGDHERSREMLAYVLRMRKRFFGMNHLDTLMTRNEIGILLCAQNKYLPVAERLISNVLTSRKQILGEEHAYTLWSVNDLSKVLCERGRPAEAAVMLQRIIPIVIRTLGETHVGMSMTKSNLARALALCGEWAQAQTILGPLIKGMPSDHPDLIHAKYGYIRIQTRLGHTDDVERGCKELLAHIAKSKILAIDHPRTIAIAEELFKVYHAQNRLEDIRWLKSQIKSLDEDNLIGDKFDVYGARKSSQSLVMSTGKLPTTLQSQALGDPRLHPTAISRLPLSTPAYLYAPLPLHSSFRVLELLPAAYDADLTYHLHLNDWSQGCAYEALSYAWGDARNKVTTLCDGRPLPITTNLQHALKQLRRPHSSRYLWVDAICIDQSNILERGQQVSVMRQIYAKARSIVVWLGQDQEGEAIKAVRFMSALARALCKSLPNATAELSKMDDLYGLTNDASFLHDSAAWLPVAWYFSRQWFQRLWVFQEVNSGPEVDVVCGSSHLSWDAVGLVATYIKRWPILRENFSNIGEGFWYNAYIMRSRHHQLNISAASMLSQGQNFVTSDPLDRIYALLGTLPLRTWENRLKPDYTRSRESLYLAVAQICLLEERDPFFLSYTQHNRGVALDDFPSWIPQWDQERVQVPIAVPKANWKASGDSSLFATIIDNNSVLKLEGIAFDSVSVKHDLDPDAVFNASEHREEIDNFDDHELLKLWRNVGTSAAYPSAEMLLEAFAATFVHGYRINYEDYEEHVEPDFSAYALHIATLCAQEASRYPSLAQVATKGDWKRYMHEAHSMSYRRSCIMTTQGYLGSVPNATEVGDVICILYGCKVPYVLRPVDGHFFLVGDAYIHGIMDGQAMGRVRDGLLEPQHFLIR